MSGVLAVLPRGEAIRNFVYSGALDAVGSRVDLSVASVVPSERVRQLLQDRYGPIVELVDRESRRASDTVQDTLDLAHGGWVRSEAVKERWRRRDAETQDGAHRWKYALKRAAARLFANQRGLAMLDGVYERVAGRVDVTDADLALLDRLRPSLVFNGSHVHGTGSTPLVLAARRLEIPTAAFVFSWDNLTSQGRVIPRYDAFLVWTEGIKRHLVAMYPAVDPDRIFVTGTPQFDSHFRAELKWSRGRYCEQLLLDPDRPIVLYSTGMPNFMPGEPWIVEDIADRIATLPSRPQLVVRLYAKDLSGRFDELRARRRDISFPPVAWDVKWLTPLPEDAELWSNMLRHADVGINVASTVSLELCMFDRPVLNVAYNPRTVPRHEIDYANYYRFDHYRPIAESGAVELVAAPADLPDVVRRALEAPDRLSRERQGLLEHFFGDVLDSGSAARVADTLTDLASSPPGSMRARG